MKDRNKQVATALLIVSVFGIGILLIRWRFSPNEEMHSVVSVKRQALPKSGNAIDVVNSPIPTTEESYSALVSSDRFYKKQSKSSEEVSDSPLTEEECQAFVSHVETLEVRADPAAAAAFRAPEAIAAMGKLCSKKGGLSPKFARCAMTKQSTGDFTECGERELRKSFKAAKAMIAEIEGAK